MIGFTGKFRHYFITALRSLKKHLFSSALSLLGLAAAFSLCIISGLILWQAYTSDGHWTNASQIYVLDRNREYSYFEMPIGFFEDVRNFSPDITNVSSSKMDPLSYTVGDKKNSAWVNRFDKNFFSMFELGTVSGDMKALEERENMVAITSEVAAEVYGDKEAIGQTFETTRGEIIKHYTVGAVYNIPQNSTLIRSRVIFKQPVENDKPYFQIYLELKKGTDVKQLYAGLNNLLIEKYPKREAAERVKLRLVPLKGAMMKVFDNPETRNRYLGLFYSSLVMLLIALLNYVSLSTAVATTRRKDIAMRKILGASKGELTALFILEMLILVSLAYGAALGLASLISPYFSSLTKPEFSAFNRDGFSIFSNDQILMLLFGWGTALLFGFLASAYPVWSMVHSNVIGSLRDAQRSVAGGGSKLRFSLLALQSLFGIGLTFIAGTIYFQISNLEYIDKGFDAENLLYIHMWGEDPKVRHSSRAIVAALKQVDGVENATQIYSYLPLYFPVRPQTFIHPNSGENARVPTMWVGDEFIELMKIPLVTGRIFLAPPQPEEGEGPLAEENVFVNERFVHDYDMGSADEILGKCLYYIIRSKREDTCRRITAVVGNHFQKLDENPITPVVFIPERANNFYNIVVRYDPDSIKTTFKEIEKIWDGFSPEQGIYYQYLDDIVEKDIRAQKAIALLVVITAIGSLVLTIAGLYAMAKFVVARRGREIAIRRVLGATTFDIVRLVVIQLVKPIILGAFMGLPVGWYYAMDWLSSYSVRIEPEPWHAVLLGLVGVAFFIFTATSEILRAVRIRPAEALHYE